jgi:hypothetical protein
MPGFWQWYDRGARIDFAGTLLSLLWDWKAWLVGGAGGVVTFLASAVRDRDPLDVWVLALLAMAAVAVIVHFLRFRPMLATEPEAGGPRFGVHGLPERSADHLSNDPTAVAAPDIVWDFDGDGRTNFLGLGGLDTGEPRISAFQAFGENRSGEPILSVNSYIQSDQTNETRKVFFVLRGTRVDPAETNGITRDGKFQVATEAFPSTAEVRELGPQGTPAGRFRTDFGPFTFVFEYDGKRYSRRFTLDDIDREISEWTRSRDDHYKQSLGPSGVARKR